MINVLLAAPFREEFEGEIIAAGGGACRFERLDYNCSEAERTRLLSGAEVIIGFIPQSFFAETKRLKWLQMTAAGVDSVLGGLPEGVKLTNASGAFGVVIAEHVLGCLLALCRLIPGYSRQKKWLSLGCERRVEGCRALILGAGDIGERTAERLRPFGVQTVGIRRTARLKPDSFDEMYTMDELDSQLAAADFVLCALPSTKQTEGLLNERRLRLMKKDAILINVGRGSLIDTKALERVMSEGHLFGAALDVTSPEPLNEDSPLWSMDNVIITPHVAGAGFGHLAGTEKKIADICCENLRRYIAGEELYNLVDPAIGYRINS